MNKFSIPAIFFLISVLQTNAQDPVAVSKEPLHKNVFENKYVRVLDLHIAPGDTTQLHKHETPCVSISLHPVRTGGQTLVDDKDPKVQSLDRRISFDGFYQSPRIHRVWNRDTAMFHWMDVEILSKGDSHIEAPIAISGFTQAFDAPPVRAYRLTLTGHKKITLKRKASILIVSLNNATKVRVGKRAIMKEGDFLFVKPSQKIQLSNDSEDDCSFAVLEMK